MLTSSDVLKQQQSQRLSASLSVALLRDDLRAMLLPAQRPTLPTTLPMPCAAAPMAVGARTLPQASPRLPPQLTRVASQGGLMGVPAVSMPAAVPSMGMQRCHSVGSMPSGVVQMQQRAVTARAVTPTPQPMFRMGSGVVQTGVPVATASFAPSPAPVASVVSVASVGAWPPSSRQPSISPRNQPAPDAKIATTPTSKATSKEGSPRFYQSHAMKHTKSEDGSPRSQSDSPKSKPTSPRNGGSVKGAAWQGKTAEEAPWEVPYSMRARSGSISPTQSPQRPQRPGKPQRSESQKRRYQDLYEDHEIRLQKWQAKLEEKKRKEEEEVQKNIANTCSPRNFSQHQFQSWYSESMNKKQEGLVNRLERKRSEARIRAFQELSECTFTPLAPTWKAKRSPRSSQSSRAGSFLSDARPVVHEGDQQAQADELVAAQVTQIDALRQLEKKEREMHEATQQVFNEFLERSLEEGRRKLKLFEETPEGREYLATRARSYMELNRGMNDSAAFAEARSDLSRASEAKLHTHAAQLRQQRVQKDAQQIQLARLKVAWELIQLQRRYSQLLDKQLLPRSMLAGFDASLVERLTKEAWYVEARSFAHNVAKPEV